MEITYRLEHNNVMMAIILTVMDVMLIVLLAITIVVQLQLLMLILIQETALQLAPMVIILTQQIFVVIYANILVQHVPTQLLVIVVQLVVIEF